jgi:predicted nuclease of predicted toxin-antitoxin system
MESSAFIISLVAVIIATASTVVSYLIYRQARDPEIVVYAQIDERRPSIINLVIENIGNSPAWNVSFSSSEPVPYRAFGIDKLSDSEIMSNGPLINGIPCFGPRAKRVLTWGQFGGIRDKLGKECLDIEAIYFSKPALSFFRKKHKSISRLDIKSFECSDVSDHNWNKKIAEELKQIANYMKSQ